MTIVSTMVKTKDNRIYVRVSSDIKEDFKRIAEYRGLKTSSLLHSLIVKTIHEEKERGAAIFQKTENDFADIEQTREEIERDYKLKSAEVRKFEPNAEIVGKPVADKEVAEEKKRKVS